MKKIITVMMIALSLALAICTTATAQMNDKYLAYSSMKPTQVLEYKTIDSPGENSLRGSDESLKNAKTNLKVSKANVREVKANLRSAENFKKTFKDQPDPSWSVLDNGIFASFYKDGIKTRVDYTKRGIWIHTLTFFTDEQTPANIRNAVALIYPNANINLSVKVMEENMEFYLVELEDKVSYKQVSVFNQEVNVIRDLQKCH